MKIVPLPFLAAAVFAAAAAAPAQVPARPNILFILTDDQGAWALGAAGNREIVTPHLDRLASEGAYLPNFFCASPVCSPAIAARLRKPADIAELPLLHTDPIDGWERWMRTQGLPVRHARRGQTFDTLELALAAATRGQGVVMSDLILAEESLRDGVLVQPFAATIEEGIGYYLVYPPERATQPKIRLLREWMLETAQGTRT